jgi:hypothetical protein
MSEVTSLALFEKASVMLAEANTIQKARELKNLALTAADWRRRKGMGEDAIQHCRSYAYEAERKMGAMLAETELQHGSRGFGKSTPLPPSLKLVSPKTSRPRPSNSLLFLSPYSSRLRAGR